MPEPAKPRGPYKKGLEHRSEVVAIAMDIFGRYGFRGGTLQQVADRFGKTPGAILKLFGSKEKLLIAVLEHWDEVTSSIIGRDTHGIDRLDGFRRLMSYHREHAGLLQLYTTMAAEATTVEHPAHAFMVDRFRRTRSDMRQILSEGVEHGDFRPMSRHELEQEAHWLLATMDGLELQFLLEPSLDLEKSFDGYLETLRLRLAPNAKPKTRTHSGKKEKADEVPG